MPSNKTADSEKSVLADRYKTKICSNFVKQGCCPYESRCMFAHSSEELRTKEMNLRDGLTTEEAIRNFKRMESYKQQYKQAQTALAAAAALSSPFSLAPRPFIPMGFPMKPLGVMPLTAMSLATLAAATAPVVVPAAAEPVKVVAAPVEEPVENCDVESVEPEDDEEVVAPAVTVRPECYVHNPYSWTTSYTEVVSPMASFSAAASECGESNEECDYFEEPAMPVYAPKVVPTITPAARIVVMP